MQQVGYEDRTKYILSSSLFGDLKIIEPIGWNEDEKELKRSDDYFGVFTSLSNNLKFVENAYDYINSVYEIYGIESEIILTKYEKDGYTDEWEVIYTGYLDLSTLEYENNKISLKFNESGFYKKIQSRKSVDFEIERLDTADGFPINEMKVDRVKLPDRKILLINQFEKPLADPPYANFRVYQQGENVISYLCPTANLIANPVPEFVTPDTWAGQPLSSSNFFYINANGVRNLRISIDLDIFIQQDITQWNTGYRPNYILQLIKFNSGTNYTKPNQTVLQTLETQANISPTVNLLYKNINEIQVTLQNGEHLALLIKLDINLGYDYIYLTFKSVTLKYNMTVSEDTLYQNPSYLNHKCLLPHETADRLVEIMTNKKNAFRSNYFGRTDIGYDNNGFGALIGLTNGFWVRGFKTNIDAVPPKTYTLTTSFDDFIKSYMAIGNLGFGIEDYKGNELVVIEELSYFFDQNITIILPEQVNNVKRSIASDLHFSSIEVGYDFDGEYEEQQGLDEYNIKNIYTTHITKSDKKYEKISKYRADSYGIEFARRKPADKFGTEDSQYDQKNFLLDMKQSLTDVFEMRKYTDDMVDDKLPSGIYSPETAQNLRLSPLNNLMRHSWYIRAGLEKYLDKYVRYSSTKGNSSLVTKPEEFGIELKENGILHNNLLKRSLINPIWIEFEHPVDKDLSMQIFGKTNGKQNFYGLVQFINEKNEVEFGYLWDLKPNGNGNWKILKANKLTYN